MPATAVGRGAWRPKRLAIFAGEAELPSMLASMLDGGPFGDVIEASRLWFWMNGDLRLGWYFAFAMTSYQGRYLAVLDAQTSDILSSHEPIHSVVALGTSIRKTARRATRDRRPGAGAARHGVATVVTRFAPGGAVPAALAKASKQHPPFRANLERAKGNRYFEKIT